MDGCKCMYVCRNKQQLNQISSQFASIVIKEIEYAVYNYKDNTGSDLVVCPTKNIYFFLFFYIIDQKMTEHR